MIHDLWKPPAGGLPRRLRADLCVVGSGPGGSMVAREAARVGMRVIVLEAGGLVLPQGSDGRERTMIPRVFAEAGGRTTADRRVRVHQGETLGGSSVHNTNLCERLPEPLRAAWRLAHLPPEAWAARYEEVEALLGVSLVPEPLWAAANHVLRRGCEVLGWPGRVLRHNRTGCVGSGLCELGCPYDAKNNALKRVWPEAIRAGAVVLLHARAVRVRHRSGRVEAVEAVVAPRDPDAASPAHLEVLAPRVCLSASATGTAALWLRSGLPAPPGSVGDTLHLHPGSVVVGDFPAPQRGWKGIPQGYACERWLDFRAAPGARGTRVWIVPVHAHPMAAALSIPGDGAFHREWMVRHPHLAALSPMLHDHGAGRVRPRGELGLRIEYALEPDDEAELAFGLARCAELLFAAGARRVLVPTDPPLVVGPGDSLSAIERIRAGRDALEVVAVHPIGTVPMGDDPARHAVDSRGRSHHLEGLWVADGSLFPASIGVPPQLSIYALGLHVGRALVASGRAG